MPKTRTAITIDPEFLAYIDRLVGYRFYASRSAAIEALIREAFAERRRRFEEGLASLDPEEEKAMAEEAMAVDMEIWPSTDDAGTSREIRWADLDPVRGHEQAGRRPVLTLSTDGFNERTDTVIAVALTSQPPRSPYAPTIALAVDLRQP